MRTGTGHGVDGNGAGGRLAGGGAEPISLTPEVVRAAPKVLSPPTSTAGCGPRPSWTSPRRPGRAGPPTTPRRSGRWFTESADSGSLVRYLETFDHTVAVMQSAEQITRVARECVEDLAATGSSTPRSATPPSSTSRGGLTLDEVVARGPGRLRRGHGGRRGRDGRGQAAADRDAPPGPLARDRGARRAGPRRRASPASTSPGPRRATRRPGTSTRSSTSSARTGTSRSMPARHSGCRRSGRRCSGAAPTGSGTASGSSTTSPSPTTGGEGWPARGVRPRPADPVRDVPVLEPADRRRRVDRPAPDRPARRAAVPGDGQHRQPADEWYLDDPGRRPPERGVRVGPARDPVAHRQRDEVGVPAVRRSGWR